MYKQRPRWTSARAKELDMLADLLREVGNIRMSETTARTADLANRLKTGKRAKSFLGFLCDLAQADRDEEAATSSAKPEGFQTRTAAIRFKLATEAREWTDMDIVAAIGALKEILESRRSGPTEGSSEPATPPPSEAPSPGSGSRKGKSSGRGRDS